MLIRPDRETDFAAAAALISAAFEGAEHSDGNEAELVAALRRDAAYIPELALTAEMDGRPAGYLMFTRLRIGESVQLALAPLAVLPEYQRRGVGGALIERGHELARSLGYAFSVVLGSEGYYPRFGYVPASRFGIRAPFEVPEENFMACRLLPGAAAPEGVAEYAAPFTAGDG